MINQDFFDPQSYLLPRERIAKSKSYHSNPFYGVLGIYFILLLFLFISQLTVWRNDYYFSDFPFHLELGISGDVYSISQLIAKISSFFPSAVAQINAVALALSIILSIFFARRLAAKLCGRYSYFLDIAVISVFFVAMIWNPTAEKAPYILAGSPNVWHNSTAIYCRLFAILSFDALFEAIACYYRYRQKTKTKLQVILRYIALSLICALCTFAKPSFAVVFMPACFIYMLIMLIKTKGGSFFPSFFTGLAFLPSIPIAFLQNIVLYTETTEQSNIAFMPFEYILIYNESISSFLIRLLLVVAFPLFVFITSIKKQRTFEHIAYISTALGLILYVFFAEDGYRFTHGNMSWSFMIALFFAFFVAAIRLIQKDYNIIFKIIGSLLLALHFIGGIAYFAVILTGGSYY